MDTPQTITIQAGGKERKFCLSLGALRRAEHAGISVNLATLDGLSLGTLGDLAVAGFLHDPGTTPDEAEALLFEVEAQGAIYKAVISAVQQFAGALATMAEDESLGKSKRSAKKGTKS